MSETDEPRHCSGCRVHMPNPGRYRTCENCRARRVNHYRTQNTRTSVARKPLAYISELSRFTSWSPGRMDKVCQHCGALHWTAEKPVNVPASALS
ncbi:hypothetical protein RO3G_16889 [Rhizopus delemar RA 99-880]|uniref:Uncharacterized protein n=1 Tax=Rhizopus delemar (strain RA 99-880 / ATCC MYA-4621 / FGSC 9543 / NRRL 43880) TaxID=246409 RepID=I1CUP8_RHIO9|nr:hypothetical protein RO3G_16889 [Rhizopus delemar RA 99-880]|eukprot:EIE92178.1 hypothetical protein RO3G_16889 [Rhizopus delemar RA 99-880]